MDQPTQQIVVATFAGSERAAACLKALEDQGFEKPWMAATRLARGEDLGDALATTAPSQHELIETSDGPVGAVGRFLGGQGNSLRRALEDRGVNARVAQSIDDELPPAGAVVVVDAGVRAPLGVQIIERTGGSVVAREPRASTD